MYIYVVDNVKYHSVVCCFASRVGENLELSLPNMKELILTNNNIQELVSPLVFSFYVNLFLGTLSLEHVLYLMCCVFVFPPPLLSG